MTFSLSHMVSTRPVSILAVWYTQHAFLLFCQPFSGGWRWGELRGQILPLQRQCHCLKLQPATWKGTGDKLLRVSLAFWLSYAQGSSANIFICMLSPADVFICLRAVFGPLTRPRACGVINNVPPPSEWFPTPDLWHDPDHACPPCVYTLWKDGTGVS